MTDRAIRKRREENTKKLLYYISSRLSSGKRYRELFDKFRCYQVEIVGNRIRMCPHVEVYPNRYRKSTRDKVSALDLALSQIEDVDTLSSEVQLIVQNNPDLSTIQLSKAIVSKNDAFVDGFYSYVSSASGKQRRWTKLI